MQKSEVNLKDPLLAAVLAYLVPGLGHLYQRRLFKAAIYSVCIISLYVYGLALSDWKIVEYRGGPGEPRTELLGFIAQAGVGLPGVFAINQSRRYRQSSDQLLTSLPEPLSAPFEGTVQIQQGGDDLQGEVTGTIELAPTAGQFGDSVIAGKIIGTMPDGREVNLILRNVRLGPVLRNDPRRLVEGDIVSVDGAGERRIGQLTSGSIPRSFWNWFAVPLSHAEEQELHGQLGKYHELALVFTMIAGLLNILAVWDAFDGPAYGYGTAPDQPSDEPAAEKSESPSETSTKGGREPATAGVTS